MKITNQQLTLIIALACTIALGVCYTSGAIKSYQVIMLGFMALFLGIIAQPAFVWWVTRIAGKSFGKGVNDYWAEILKEQTETGRKNDFYFAWKLPAGYIPTKATIWHTYDMALFEIDGTEISERFGKNDPRYQNRRNQTLTIIYKPSTQKIIATTTKTIDQIAAWLTENEQFYTTKHSTTIIPTMIREMGFGQPIEATTQQPTTGQAKK